MKKKTKENASEGLNSDAYAEKLKRIIFDNFDKKDIITKPEIVKKSKDNK